MTSFLRLLRACAPVCFAAACLAAALLAPAALHAQSGGSPSISGTVLDPSGAAIPGATLHLHSRAADRSATSDGRGRFTLTLPVGTYTVNVTAPNFRAWNNPALIVSRDHNPDFNVTLEIDTATEEIVVSADAGAANSADANRSALVFDQQKLDTFSDDPATMEQQLLALGGSDPGNPPQLYVDGFSNGTFPPKESIREIRINQNPFTAQYDQFGQGRIEIFTKPGANKLHGSFEARFGSSALNARNPYSTGPEPSYGNQYLSGDLNGPIGKHSSFYFSGAHNNSSSNADINAVTLDSTFAPVAITSAVATPGHSQNYSIRFDRQFGATDTLIGRYSLTGSDQTNSGVGGFSLASQAVNSSNRSHTLQLTDTHLFGPKVVLDAALQYIRTLSSLNAVSADPSLVVQGSFYGGGSPTQALHDHLDRLELQQYLSISAGKHFVRTGVRYRMTRDANLASANYNGQYTFSSLTAYQLTLQGLAAGKSDAQIRSTCVTGSLNAQVCGGASQFTIAAGTPNATILTGDLGLYGEDEWKVTKDFTFNYGLRIESQSAIPDHLDLAPRLGFAYSLASHAKGKDPLLVVRGGIGLFYDRFASGNLLQSLRQNGIAQQVYFQANPSFFPAIPSPSALSASQSTVYRIDPNLRSPFALQGMFSAEHSFGRHGSLTLSYYQRRSERQFASINLNAPLPGTYVLGNPNSGIRPLGNTGNVYEFVSTGLSNGHTLAINSNADFGKRINLWSFFGIGRQESNTQGAGSFPSNSYDLNADAGPYAQYSRFRLYTGINARPGWDTSFNVFFVARSQAHFNITTGLDNNGDTIYNDRPSFATDLSRSSVVHTAWGVFDTEPVPGQTIIPINYGNAPGSVYMETYFNKSFRFGPRPASPAPATQHDTKPATGKPGELPPPRYRILLGIGADNVFNHVNPGTPIGVLSSPFFGRSTTLNTNFGGNPSANRTVSIRSAFFF